MFGRRKNRNWDLLRGRGFGETSATRDVHGDQVLDRGDRAETSSKVPRAIMAFIFGVLIAGIGYAIGVFVLYFLQIISILSTGDSIVGFVADMDAIYVDKRLWIFTAVTFVFGGLIVFERLMAGWRSENVMADGTDINPHLNDQHVMLTEEMQESLDWFPNAGAHSSVQVSSMLSHMMLSNKGLKKVKVPKRVEKDYVDSDGIQRFKGEVVHDKSGNIIYDTKPLIDEEFGQELLTASEIPIGREAQEVRRPYDVRKIPYNPAVEGDKRKDNPQRVDRDKLPYDTVADLINDDWEMPPFEVQRPGGAYLVDTAPVNTMVLAITRGGKGTLAPII